MNEQAAQQLKRLVSLRVSAGDSEADADAVDDLFTRFQQEDDDGKGSVDLRTFIAIACDLLKSSDQKKIDFDALSSGFKGKRGGIDYTAFCRQLQERIASKVSLKQNSGDAQAPRSPKRRRNPALEVDVATSESDVTKRTIRVDKRLETQRVLTQSIRKKLLRGVLGSRFDGFLGVQEALFHLDEHNEGYLGERAFVKQVLGRLKHPLTKAETEFLLANLRMRSQHNGAPRIDYEQMAIMCNLESDDSASDDDTDAGSKQQQPSAARPPSSPVRVPQLGADFLAAEKRLEIFLHQPMSQPDQKGDIETPRSAYSGAEMFLELAERIDEGKTGFLSEKDFQEVLRHCRVDVSATLLKSILSRFTRASDNCINYSAFLGRYAHDPRSARERRKLKVAVAQWLKASGAHALPNDLLAYMRLRLEQYDKRLHNQKKGRVPREVVVRVLCNKSRPWKLPLDSAIALVDLFARVTAGTSKSQDDLDYNAFLSLIEETIHHNQPKPQALSSPTKNAALAQSSQAAPASSVDVADYLITSATVEERANFERLMEILNDFSTTRRQPPPPSSSPTKAPSSPKHTLTASSPKATAPSTTPPPPPAVTPIDRGIALALGPRLQVRIQFNVT